MKPLARHTKEFFLTAGVIGATLLIYIFAPESESVGQEMQGLIVGLIFFALLPIVYVRIILKKPMRELGLQMGEYRENGFITLCILFLALIGFLVAVSFFQNFQTFYILPARIEGSFWWFVAYELLLVPLVVFVYEVFFRGFVMLEWLAQKMGIWSIGIQGALFFGLMLVTGSLSWNTAPLVYFAFFSGLIAYRSRSLAYSVLAQWVFLLVVDVYFLVIR